MNDNTVDSYLIGRTSDGRVSVAWASGDSVRDPVVVTAEDAESLAEDLQTWASRVREESE